MNAQTTTPDMRHEAERLPGGLAATRYGRSWVNVLIDAVERLPGPPWAAYTIALVPALLLTAIPSWISGGRLGVISGLEAVWAFALVGSLWLIHALDGVARTALREFSPLLDVSQAALARLEHDLTVIPVRPALILLAASAFRTTEAFVFQPESEALTGFSPLAIAIRWPFETVLVGLVLALLYHTVRQLRLVARIHKMAPRINLFRPTQLYAFSRLTSRTAMGLVTLIIPFIVTLTISASALDYVVTLTFMGLILGTALSAFVWPLVGMHRRMDLEKNRLQTELSQRIEAVIEDLHGSIDRRDFSGADGQNKTLASLVTERDLVGRFSIWPWQAGTAGAVVSAVLLPIALWLTTRIMEQILSNRVPGT